MINCDLCNDGFCTKLGDKRKCNPYTKKWLDINSDTLEAIDVSQICRESSLFGNACYKITREQLEALEQGKVLYDIDEYGTFIYLEPKKEVEK